jgi:hypothetical protein
MQPLVIHVLEKILKKGSYLNVATAMDMKEWNLDKSKALFDD